MKKNLALFLPIILGLAVTAFVVSKDQSTEKYTNTSAEPEEFSMTVWKSPTCSCCQAWIDYMIKNGFESTSFNLEDVTVQKKKLGLNDSKLYSCHTAKIGDYVVEGHVPVADIKRMLKEKPDIEGLTAPGMPMDSPGMRGEIPKGYDVLAINKDGSTSVYSSY